MTKNKSKFLSFLLSVTMALSSFNALTVMADGEKDENSSLMSVQTSNTTECTHHTHDDSCGYAEEISGKDCNHTHTDECYKEAASCVHQHTDECYPVVEEPATPPDAAEPTACQHTCGEECVKKELDCKHQHDEQCGYSAGTPASPCTFVCEECAKQDGGEQENTVPMTPLAPAAPTCTCETKCAEGAVKTDCPLCSAEGADLALCVGAEETQPTAAEQVQELIDALPTVDEVKAMNEEDRKAVYDRTQAAYEAYLALTEEEKATVTGTEIFETLFTYFNTLTMTLPTEDCPFTITNGDNPATENTDYTWDNTAKKLTIKTSGLTVANTNPETNASAVIVVENNVTTLTLAGVNITAPNNFPALSTGGTLNITLADGSTNTLTGGSASGNGSSYGISATGGLTINGTGTLHATGGAASGSGVSAGIFSNASITIDGGEVTATGGASTGTNGTSFGIYAKGSGNSPITIKGGTVTATGGQANAASCGMSASGSITIENGTVTATGDTATNNSYGLRASSSNITISGGSATATSYGMAAKGAITITGGTGTATTTGTSATNKGAMNKEPSFTNVGVTSGAWNKTSMSWGEPTVTPPGGGDTTPPSGGTDTDDRDDDDRDDGSDREDVPDSGSDRNDNNDNKNDNKNDGKNNGKEEEFWKDVANDIENTDKGGTVEIDADGSTKLPPSVVEALEEKDVTLVINWNGKQIVIPAGKAPKGLENYTMSKLAKMFADTDKPAAPADKPTAPTPTDTAKPNPETGAESALPSMIMAAASLVGLAVLGKKR